MVPEGWILTPIGKHIDLLSGFPFKSSGYIDEGGVRLLRGDNIEPGSLRWKNAKRWSEYDYHELKKYQLKEGDFVIAMDRTWISSGLKVAEVTQGDVPSLLVQRVSRIRALFSIEQSLLRQYFSGYRFEQYVKSVQKETAVPHISAAQIKDFPVLLPPKKEQQKIAEILSTWDEAIATTEQLLASSEQQKKALMQQLLTGKKRLPGFEGEWEWVKARDLFSSVSTRNNAEGEPLLAVTQEQGVLPRSMLDRRVVMPGGSTSGYKLVQPGNFVISLRSFQGGLEYSGFRGLVSPAYTVLEAKEKACDAYYKHYFKSQYFIGRLAVAVIGIRDGKQVSYSDFSFLKMPCPSPAEQAAIARVLDKGDEEVACLAQALSDLKAEKRALMQQLLTGKRRVKVDEAERATA